MIPRPYAEKAEAAELSAVGPKIPSWVRTYAKGNNANDPALELQHACAAADAHAVKRQPDAPLLSWVRTLEDIYDVNRKGRHYELSDG